jgi:SPP1 family phage portal protein
MEIEELINQDLPAAIKKLTAKSKDSSTIDLIINEFEKNDRDIRQTQVGQIQKTKTVGKGSKAKTVNPVRITVPFQKKIVKTAAAFELGEPVTLVPNVVNDLSKEVIRLWKINRIDDKLQKAKVIQKSQTQSALHFYIKDLSKEASVNKQPGVNILKEIKVNVLSQKEGKMTPVFNGSGNMNAFVWEFKTLDEKGKSIDNVWVFTEKNVIECSTTTGSMAIDSQKPHGFGNIPVVYMDQDFPEWHDVETLIDRFETCISKLGGSNDYSGYPLIKLYGEAVSMPDRDDDGKTLRFPMKEADANGKVSHGDADFMTNSSAADSIKLELENLESLIYAISSTPNLSFDNMKSLGNISGIALKLMFLDSILKAKMNEGENRTIIERIINVFISGTITTTVQKMAANAKELFVDVKFNSILPDDTKEAIEFLTKAVDSGIMAKKTAVEHLGMNENVDEELLLIAADAVLVQGPPFDPTIPTPDPLLVK